jgi:hypothetical protein
VNRLRTLLLPALALLLLALPSGAGAASIETHSIADRGHLSVDVHALGGGYYKWNALHYRLHICHPGATAGAECHWELWGRISRSYVDQCPAHEEERPEAIALTFFHRLATYGDPVISTGVGHVALPHGWGSDHRQLLCWYTQVYGSTALSLTAQTVILH